MILKEIGIIKSPYKGKERSQNEKSLSRYKALLCSIRWSCRDHRDVTRKRSHKIWDYIK